MKTVGIIGGLGPETTAAFYLEVLFGCQQVNHRNRPPILMWNVPLDLAIEKDLLLHSKGEKRYLPFLIDAAKRLENGGADFLVLPCNTLHIFIEDIRNAVEIPVLSIIEETTTFLEKIKIKRVGVLATTASLDKKLYKSHFFKKRITHVVPNGLDQARIGKIISRLVHSRHANKDREDILKIINKFEKKDVSTVLLACTDLHLLLPDHPTLEIHDTMKILADATVAEILA